MLARMCMCLSVRVPDRAGEITCVLTLLFTRFRSRVKCVESPPTVWLPGPYTDGKHIQSFVRLSRDGVCSRHHVAEYKQK